MKITKKKKKMILHLAVARNFDKSKFRQGTQQTKSRVNFPDESGTVASGLVCFQRADFLVRSTSNATDFSATVNDTNFSATAKRRTTSGATRLSTRDYLTVISIELFQLLLLQKRSPAKLRSRCKRRSTFSIPLRFTNCKSET